ncbi:MAG: hypothetical protein SFW36_13100 [Leptolyngbyaceae cyanobacterium bins.59]|nr:hypothetical protein [Leptolyngbyaceae cyanobacterium bins.59]
MLGTLQQSNLRIELDASASTVRESLVKPALLQQWLWPQRLPEGLPEELQSGAKFTTCLGPIAVHHQVQTLESDRLVLLLSQGIDGFHEWIWGDGWVQSRLEGVTLLPINLGQTVSLWRLREYLVEREKHGSKVSL